MRLAALFAVLFTAVVAFGETAPVPMTLTDADVRASFSGPAGSPATFDAYRFRATPETPPALKVDTTPPSATRIRATRWRAVAAIVVNDPPT